MSESQSPPAEPTGSPVLDEVLGILTAPPARPAPRARLPDASRRPAAREDRPTPGPPHRHGGT